MHKRFTLPEDAVEIGHFDEHEGLVFTPLAKRGDKLTTKRLAARAAVSRLSRKDGDDA